MSRGSRITGNGSTAELSAATLRRGMARQAAGDLAGAEAQFRKVLKHHPEHVDALHLLGVLMARRGRLAEAIRLMSTAVSLNPRDYVALSNLGRAIQEQGRHEVALGHFDRALAIKPDFADAWNHRGNALRALGRPAAALDDYRRATDFRPDFTDAWTNRGTALMDLGRFEEAVASYDRALTTRPGAADALCYRGNALVALGRHAEALASYDRAIAARPDYAEAHNSRGNALRMVRRYGEAVASYDQALALHAGYVEARYNRGVALQDAGSAAAALADYQQVLAARPDFVDAWSTCAKLLQELKRDTESIACYQRALDLDPDHAWALGGRLYSRLRTCDWRDFETEVEQLTSQVRAGQRCSMPFLMLAVSDSPADQRQCAATYGEAFFPPAREPLWQGEPYRHDRLRVAYLSADFHDHATAYLMAEAFEAQDRSRFQVSALSFGPDRPGPMRQRLLAAFENFIEVRDRSDRDIAVLMREMEIDVAVDLKGYTQEGRPGIFAWRPAPVVVNYLGYPGTTGLPYVDYVLGDGFVIPVGQEDGFSERVVRLPGCYQPNDSRRAISPRVPGREEVGLPPSGFVFCCFNNNFKITPPVFATWMGILESVPGSVLWLFQDNEAAAANLGRHAAEAGVDPARLVFAGRVPVAEHLARQRLADLFLDTFPYNAHTTASDALWAGVPLVTCAGKSFAARVAGSLLTAVGQPGLITGSLAEYGSLAVALARDPQRLQAIRAALAGEGHRSPVFDGAEICRHLEDAFVSMASQGGAR